MDIYGIKLDGLNKEAAGTICLIVGIIVLFAGAWLGWRTPRVTPVKDAKVALEAALKALDEASTKAEGSRELLANRAPIAEIEGDHLAAAQELQTAADGATEKAKEATAQGKTALEQVEGMIGSLPENLRFAGLLVLVGTVLIGVATIQFGGVSIF